MMRIKGYDGELPQPLSTGNIPRDAMLHSPRQGNPHGTVRPSYPGESGFDDKLEEVIQVRAQVELRAWPEEYLTSQHPVAGAGNDVPRLLNHLALGRGNPQTCADVVSMDKPSDLGLELFSRLVKEAPIKDKYLAQRGNVAFVEGFAQFNAMLGVGCYLALDKIFDVKYYWMLERPETVKLLPGCIFSGDEYGAPNHPAYGAGHGAVSGMTYELLRRFFKLSKSLEEETLDACYQFSHWRTLLGVHYRDDNDVGMEVGASIVDKITAVS